MPIGFAGWALLANTATNAYAANQAKEASEQQMAFQAGSSANAVQTRVRDLRAAGINPILAAGQAAQAMPGSQPQRFFDGGEAVSSALQGRRLQQEVKVMRAQEDLADDSASRERAQQRLLDEQRRGHMFDNVGKETMIRSGVVDAEATARRNEARMASTASQIERQLDESSDLYRILKRLGVSGGSASSLLRR